MSIWLPKPLITCQGIHSCQNEPNTNVIFQGNAFVNIVLQGWHFLGHHSIGFSMLCNMYSPTQQYILTNTATYAYGHHTMYNLYFRHGSLFLQTLQYHPRNFHDHSCWGMCNYHCLDTGLHVLWDNDLHFFSYMAGLSWVLSHYWLFMGVVIRGVSIF